MLVDASQSGRSVQAASATGCHPPARLVKHPQPLGFQHIGVVHPGVAGGMVGQRRPRWFLAVAVAVALVTQILRVVAGPVAGRDGEVATQHRPAGGMLVDQIPAGGVGGAVEVAGDRVEQDAALVGGVAVVVAVDAVEAALGVGRAMTDRVLTGCHSWRRVGPPVPLRCRARRRSGVWGWRGRGCECRRHWGRRVALGAGAAWRLLPVDPGHGGPQQVVVVAAGGLSISSWATRALRGPRRCGPGWRRRCHPRPTAAPGPRGSGAGWDPPAWVGSWVAGRRRGGGGCGRRG